MAGWVKAWPTGLKDRLKKLGYSDKDVADLMKSVSAADAKKHVLAMEAKNKAKAAELEKVLKEAGLKF